MKIKDLPPKLREKATNLWEYYNGMHLGCVEDLWEFPVDDIVSFQDTDFWTLISEGNFEDAYKLRPDLREPFCTEAQKAIVYSNYRDEKINQYDYINPDHYKKGDKEVWEMMVDIWGVEKYIAHCEMCAYKYLQRLGKKPGQPISRDLQKASWYLNKVNELRDGMD